MYNKNQLLALAAVLVLVTGFVVGLLTALPVHAQTISTLRLYHKEYYGGGDVTTPSATAGVTVTYRTGHYVFPVGIEWSDWTDPASSSSGDECSPHGTFRWDYVTDPIPGGETIVEFKVEVAPNNPGTKCSDGGSIDYSPLGDELNKLTTPGGTASITAGGYGLE